MSLLGKKNTACRKAAFDAQGGKYEKTGEGKGLAGEKREEKRLTQRKVRCGRREKIKRRKRPKKKTLRA